MDVAAARLRRERGVGRHRTGSFPTQSDAESWLGEQWPDLLEAGVDDVVLFEGGREVYGPMSLHTPQP